MTPINETIQRLKLIIKDENCARMNQSTVKGYLGELLVKAKLESEGLKLFHQGNQTGHDLEYTNDNQSVKIDVKCSSQKSEFDKVAPNWGWALQHENKTKPITCTHFVCLALDKENE